MNCSRDVKFAAKMKTKVTTLAKNGEACGKPGLADSCEAGYFCMKEDWTKATDKDL